MTGYRGTYYDGRSSRAHPVAVQCTADELHTTGDGVARIDPLEQIVPSAPLAGVPFTLRFADGARMQLPPDTPVAAWFPGQHRLERRVNRLEKRAGVAAIAVLVVVLALLALFGWGVPAAADYVALRLPTTVDHVIGKQTLAVLRTRVLSPSRLPAATQTRLQDRFHAFATHSGDSDPLQLRFFHAPAFGANAFSLGGGIIVVSDGMVDALSGDDDAFLAVVAHEMGHAHYRHTLRMVLRGSGIAIVASVLIGDVSGGTLVAAIPVFLLNAHYSRGFEQQADDYAFATLARAGISPLAFVHAMQALEKAHPQLRNDADTRYLSTHPVTAARIARAKAAALRFQHAQSADR